MAVLLLRNFAYDIFWAVLALVASMVFVAPSFFSVLYFNVSLPDVLFFLFVTVFPSVIIWTLFGFYKHESRIFFALCCQVVITLISIVLFYTVSFYGLSVTDWSNHVVLSGLSAFAAFKFVGLIGERLFSILRGAGKRVLIVGDGALADNMEEFISSSKGRYIFLGRVSCPSVHDNSEENIFDEPLINSRSGKILRLAQNMMADLIVVSLAERRGVFPVEELLNCKLAGITVIDAPTFYEVATKKLLIENITPSWFIFSHGFKVTKTLRLCKRIVDIFASLFGLIMLSPLIPFIAIAIKLESEGPVLFKQVRVGEGDKEFVLMKFRSMRSDAEAVSGAVWSQENDPRITRVGRLLRMTRLDEIPQLLNILNGDMSLVGPRPERPEFVQNLTKHIPYYSERHYVKPGLTGWAQVCYPYGSSVEDAIEKLRFDLYYIKNISLLFDFYIIFKTFGVVLLGKGR